MGCVIDNHLHAGSDHTIIDIFGKKKKSFSLEIEAKLTTLNVLVSNICTSVFAPISG